MSVMNSERFKKIMKKEISILILFLILVIVFYLFFPTIHCYLIFEKGPMFSSCVQEGFKAARETRIFDIFWDVTPITILSALLTIAYLKRHEKIFFIALILLSVFSYGIPYHENKILWGIEDTWMHFIHSRHVYDHGSFLFDPNDLITRMPNYFYPLSPVLSTVFSRVVGIDVIYSWIMLCFASTLVSSFFVYLIAKLLTKKSGISFIAAIFAFSVSYRTLAWTHTEVFATPMVLGGLYFVLKYALFRDELEYLILCGLFVAGTVLTHVVPGFFMYVLIFSLSLHRLIEKHDVKILIPVILGITLSSPYFYELLTGTNFLGSERNRLIGRNWLPFMCTDLRFCSPVFMGLITTFLLVFFGLAFRYKKDETYRLILSMVLVSSFLLYHVVLYRWGLLPSHTQSHRFSSLTFITYSFAAVFVLKDLKKPIKIMFVFLFIFFGFYYSFYEGKDASFSIRLNSEEFVFFTWIRENIHDARFLLYETSPIGMTKFYDITGKNYVLPSTSRKIEGEFWESGFVSLTKNREQVRDRVNEWLELDKTSSEDVRNFFLKYNVTHVLYFKGENTEEFKVLNQTCTLLRSGAGAHLFMC